MVFLWGSIHPKPVKSTHEPSQWCHQPLVNRDISDDTGHLKWTSSLVLKWSPPLFVLWFAFTMIHTCMHVSGKKQGRPRNIYHVMWTHSECGGKKGFGGEGWCGGGGGRRELTTNMYTVFLRGSSNGSSFTVDCVNICGPGSTQWWHPAYYLNV